MTLHIGQFLLHLFLQVKHKIILIFLKTSSCPSKKNCSRQVACSWQKYETIMPIQSVDSLTVKYSLNHVTFPSKLKLATKQKTTVCSPLKINESKYFF